MNFLPFDINVDVIRKIIIIVFSLMIVSSIFMRSQEGNWTIVIRNYFLSITLIVVGATSILRIGTIDFHSMMATLSVLVPALLVMGLLGHWIGSIMDNPKNREDADYRLSVLNALKNMDKSITLEELNDKLTKTIEEPDAPEEPEEEENEG